MVNTSVASGVSVRERRVRNVEVSLLPIWHLGLYFQEAFGHDEVDCTGMYELTMEPGDNLAE